MGSWRPLNSPMSRLRRSSVFDDFIFIVGAPSEIALDPVSTRLVTLVVASFGAGIDAALETLTEGGFAAAFGLTM